MTSLNPVAIPVTPLEPSKLRAQCDPRSFSFTTTDDLEPIDTLVGQDRALGAIRFGSEIDRPGYNLFALGPQGTGRHTAILSYLGQKATEDPAPR